MRILTLEPGPDWSVQDCHVGWLEAFADLGCRVRNVNFNDRLRLYSATHVRRHGRYARAFDDDTAAELANRSILADLYEGTPDLLFVTSAFYVNTRVLDLARKRGTRVVILHTESPYEDDRQVRMAEHADLNLVNDPTNLARFPAGTRYVPHSYRPLLHRPRRVHPRYRSEFCFVGTGFPSRIRFFEDMDLTGIDVALAGNWDGLPARHRLRKHVAHDIGQCLDNTETARLYAGAKVSLNLYRREAERPELSAGWAMGPREVEMAACGLFYLRDPRPEGDELLPMLPTFTEPAEATDLIRHYLTHPRQRLALARQARAAMSDRTFTAQAKQLLSSL